MQDPFRNERHYAHRARRGGRHTLRGTFTRLTGHFKGPRSLDGPGTSAFDKR